MRRTKTKQRISHHEERYPQFFEEIVASPDDDGPRLVFADFLDELGDPRGEFIRLQCELEDLPSYHPRYWKMADRVAQLQRENANDWMPRNVSSRLVAFRRGFAESLDLTQWTGARRTSPNPLLQSLPLLRFLTINYLPEAYHRPFVNSDFFQGLRELNLSIFLDPSFLRFATQSNLESLVVCATENASIVIDVLSLPAFRSLRRLAIRGLGTDTSGISQLLEEMKADYLTHIKIRSSNASVRDLRRVFQSEWAHEIVSLDFSHNDLGDEPLSSITPSQPLANLRELSLLESGLQRDYSFYADHCPQLQKLAVSIPNIDIDFLQRIVDGGLQLRSLAITDSNLGVAGVRKLTTSPLFSSLTELDLSRNQLQTKHIEELVRSPNLANLHSLKLAGNQLTDPAALAIADAPYLGNLRYLDLSHNRLRDRGAEALANSVAFNSLVESWLYYNQFDEASAALLRNQFGRGCWV